VKRENKIKIKTKDNKETANIFKEKIKAIVFNINNILK